ncbi:potassium transporter [Cylindrobasidium torrendii FP15055 ss-10]|uniref:Potassium transporter n=1 Tax=Cylindrobasidium torrendii FP15055 ss-10 TaxID=1314674 RepID=A0A0D7BCP5_9AGAR|nr:potassium transporter [Cylindrobasidium torrendii FP15055 ss-10]
MALSALEAGHVKREALSVSGSALLYLSFQTLGIIYSDIGTSPLYVLNGIWPAAKGAPSREDVIGGVSAIVWSITLLPLFKYVFVSMFFATQEGEGGSFALFQGIYPRRPRDTSADRTLTGDYTNGKMTAPKPTKTLRERMRWPLLIWSLAGTALTMADGVFTPAVSVTSAVGGIAVAKASVTEDIVPISIAFLLVLFFVQQFGTARLAVTFAPISMIWFLLILSTGIYNITTYPGIFRALDPSRAVMLFVRTKDYGLLSGILLSVTGCEAIFANVGQFNAASIRMSFICLVYPSLVLTYLGQGAKLITDGENVIQNVFYRSIPGPLNGPLWWIVWLFALLATILASQAMITASFSLMQQLITMKSFPSLRMLYTSETIQGQIYIPAANWTLMVGTIVIVAAFSDLTALTNAYGFAVATVMLSTTGLITVHIIWVKRLPWYAACAFFLWFGFFDALFFGAAVKKIPEGAWVPLMIGGVLAIIMTFWTWAKGLEDAFDGKNRRNLRDFIQRDEKSSVTFHLESPINEMPSIEFESESEEDTNTDFGSRYFYVSQTTSTSLSQKEGVEGKVVQRKELSRISSCAIFHKLTEGSGVPHSFIGFVRQWPALPEVLIFLSISIVPFARVAPEDRYIVTKVRSIEGFYGATYCIGFRDKFDVQISDLIERICELEMRMDPQRAPVLIEKIRNVSSSTTHVIPSYHVVSKKLAGGKVMVAVSYMRKYLIEAIYRRLATMFPETANWLTSADEIIRVGINASI